MCFIFSLSHDWNITICWRVCNTQSVSNLMRYCIPSGLLIGKQAAFYFWYLETYLKPIPMIRDSLRVLPIIPSWFLPAPPCSILNEMGIKPLEAWWFIRWRIIKPRIRCCRSETSWFPNKFNHANRFSVRSVLGDNRNDPVYPYLNFPIYSNAVQTIRTVIHSKTRR